jgi:hypothetical protein
MVGHKIKTIGVERMYTKEVDGKHQSHNGGASVIITSYK